MPRGSSRAIYRPGVEGVVLGLELPPGIPGVLPVSGVVLVGGDADGVRSPLRWPTPL